MTAEMPRTRGALVVLGFLILFLCASGLPVGLTGCTAGNSVEEEQPVDEDALKEQFAAEAESEITEENADAALSELEEEVESDDEGT